MALAQVNVIKKGQEAESGGGLLGSIVGAIAMAAAAIAAPATGGASLAAIPTIAGAAGTGAALGNIAGSVISPGSRGTQDQNLAVGQLPKTASSSMERRFNSFQGPTAGMGESRNQLSQLEDSMRALSQAPQDLQRQHSATMLGAHSILSRRG